MAEVVRAVRVEGLDRRRAGAGARPPSRPIDPVCGMTVVIGPDTPHLTVDGREHWFCGAGCRDRFAVGRRRVTVTGLVLAAGSSNRLGRPKQLLPFRGPHAARRLPRPWPAPARSTSCWSRSARRPATCAPRSTSAAWRWSRTPSPPTGARRRSWPPWPHVDPAADGLVLLLGDQPGVTRRRRGGAAPRAGADSAAGGRPLRRRHRPPVLVPARRVRRPRHAARRQGACGSCSSRAGTRCARCGSRGRCPSTSTPRRTTRPSSPAERVP